MPPDPFPPDTECPVCGHLVSTGAHDLVSVPGSDVPMLRCPSFAEFYLDHDFVLYDQDAKAPINREVQIFLDGKSIADAVKPPDPTLE